jgi:hypothetical protein
LPKVVYNFEMPICHCLHQLAPISKFNDNLYVIVLFQNSLFLLKLYESSKEQIPLSINNVKQSSISGKFKNFRNVWTIFIFLKLYKHFLLKINFMSFKNKLILHTIQIFQNEKKNQTHVTVQKV